MFFDTITKKLKVNKYELKVLPRPPIKIDRMHLDEVLPGEDFYWDIECFPNFFFVGFLCKRTHKVITFELSPDCELDISGMHWLLWASQSVGFNTNNYDIPLACYAIDFANNAQLKSLSDAIIYDNARVYDCVKEFGFKLHPFNSIDLIEVAPLKASLKKYAARMHAKRLQELPYDPNEPLTAEQAAHVRDYCITDLENTALLHKELEQQIALRVALSKQYGQDLRSHSDAQIAETIIVSEVKRLTGRYPNKAKVNVGEAFCYEPPEYISFKTDVLKSTLIRVADSIFIIDENGYPRCPAMQELTLRIGSTDYAMGLGGLHSQEKCRALVANDEYTIKDIDVASYYPRLILNANIRPQGMGDSFAPVYKSVVDRRLIAKKEKNTVEADSLKITANGTFGKLLSSFSAMYAPKGGIQVTLTGQLTILMLIEQLELAGFEVVSGNTDGIMVRCLRSREAKLAALVKLWEQTTGLETEETIYTAVYQRDVNNYIAIKPDGTYKVKGVYAEKGSTGNSRLSKNPEGLIISDAVIALLVHKIPIEQTIRNCTNFTRFVIVREVKGGGHWNGTYLGKVVRYYYGSGRGAIYYIQSGNKVANSDNATPCMDLPDKFPLDIDYDRYIREANDVLIEIGHTRKQEHLF